MRLRLYAFSLSHPAQAARLMIEHKGLEPQITNLPPGVHPVILRALGFSRGTVPALRADGVRVQGSTVIPRFLEERIPEPPLYPSDPTHRAAVEEAEQWGEAELQPVPRRVFRWIATRSNEARRFVAGTSGLPGAVATAPLQMPVAWILARDVGATTEQVRADLVGVPAMLDRVDALIDEGVIGGAERNAADFQIGTSVAAIAGLGDLSHLVAGRPAERLASSLLPPDELPGPAPALLPREWVPRAIEAT